MDAITLSILNEFSTSFDIQNNSEDSRFEHLAAWLAVRRHHSDYTFNPSDLVTGSGGDTGIDAIGVIVNNNLVTDVDDVDSLIEVNGYLDVTFVFVQAERSSNFDTAKLGQFGHGVRDFFSDASLPRNETVQRYADIRQALFAHWSKFRPGNPACFMYYVTTGKGGQKDGSMRTRADTEAGDIAALDMFREVSCALWGADQIRRFYLQTKNAIAREFLFDQKTVIPDVEGVRESYLGHISATDFISLIQDDDGNIVKSLFYENIRDWEGYNKINTEIRETLRSESRDRFILMNNGVTVIAGQLHKTGNRFYMEDYYIVNGCQTSHVLHDNHTLLTDKVRIPFRLICTKDESVIEDVITATNRQTEVKDTQFFAMKDFAKALEQHFRSYSVERRIYYERRAHQYDNQEIEKARIIAHPNLVRAVGAMFLGEPHITTKSFRQLTGLVGREMFKDGDRYEPYYVAGFSLFKLEQSFKRGLDTKFKAARYQILLALRFLMDGVSLPPMNAREMGRRCDAMTTLLWNPERIDGLMCQAASVIEQVGGDWDRDSIRTESVTKAIFERFGQRYSGGRKGAESDQRNDQAAL